MPVGVRQDRELYRGVGDEDNNPVDALELVKPIVVPRLQPITTPSDYAFFCRGAYDPESGEITFDDGVNLPSPMDETDGTAAATGPGVPPRAAAQRQPRRNTAAQKMAALEEHLAALAAKVTALQVSDALLSLRYSDAFTLLSIRVSEYISEYGTEFTVLSLRYRVYGIEFTVLSLRY